MTGLENLVRTPLAKALGWTLFHSLWEGAVVAAVLLAARFATRSPRGRYAAACLAMLAIAAAFALTFWRLLPAPTGGAAMLVRPLPSPSADGSQWIPDLSARFRGDDVLPWLTPFWIAGVVFFNLRGAMSWLAARRLRARGVCLASSEWQERLVRLRERARVSKPVALLESCLADVPAVAGWLRPAILMPVGLLAGMPVHQIEAILLHELAHIRRQDYLVNLMQMAVESLLFYHPAIWWITGMVRTERENCCDDLVLAANGDAHEYAAALTALEQNRWAVNEATTSAALAATGGNLVKRVRRLLNPLTASEGPRAVLSPVLSAGILALTAALALTAWQASVPAQAPNAEISAWAKWLHQDVTYIITDAERKAFQALQTDDERKQFVEQFWLRRDPTPGTVENEFFIEHYRRIAYANRHFTDANGLPGWKTDPGRIYITFGPPDEIDAHPSGQPFPFQDWTWKHLDGIGDMVHIRFVDKDSTGDYHMTMDPNPQGGRFVKPPAK